MRPLTQRRRWRVIPVAAAVRRYMTDKIRPLAGAGMGSDVGRQGGAMADNGMAVTGQGK